MITIWMAVSLGGGTAFFMCCSKCFHVCKVSAAPVYKKKKRLVISGKVIRSVLPLQYCSTFLKVLEYFLCSTVVLSWKYWFYERMMH
mgnify:FL=1